MRHRLLIYRSQSSLMISFQCFVIMLFLGHCGLTMLQYILQDQPTFLDTVLWSWIRSHLSANNQRHALCAEHLTEIPNLSGKLLCLHYRKQLHMTHDVLFTANWQTSVLICAFCFKLLCEEAIKCRNIHIHVAGWWPKPLYAFMYCGFLCVSLPVIHSSPLCLFSIFIESAQQLDIMWWDVMKGMTSFSFCVTLSMQAS